MHTTKQTARHTAREGAIMTCDIITTVPWQCGDERDCTSPGGWHKKTFWTADIIQGDTETGYTVDEFSDGDHEECDETDVPTNETERWREYYRWVVNNDGQDPLYELCVPARKIRETWTVAMRPSIVGYVLLHARKAHGKRLAPADVPKRVLEYFELSERSKGRWSTFGGGDDGINCREYMKLANSDPDCRVSCKIFLSDTPNRGQYVYFTTTEIGHTRQPSKTAIIRAARQQI